MLCNCLESVNLSLIPHFQEKPDTQHESDLLHLTNTAFDPSESAFALLSYLTVQI